MNRLFALCVACILCVMSADALAVPPPWIPSWVPPPQPLPLASDGKLGTIPNYDPEAAVWFDENAV